MSKDRYPLIIYYAEDQTGDCIPHITYTNEDGLLVIAEAPYDGDPFFYDGEDRIDTDDEPYWIGNLDTNCFSFHSPCAKVGIRKIFDEE